MKKLNKFIDYVSDLALLLQAKAVYKTMDFLSKKNRYTQIGYCSMWGAITGGTLRGIGMDLSSDPILSNKILNLSTAVLVTSATAILLLRNLKWKFYEASTPQKLQIKNDENLKREADIKIKKEMLALYKFINKENKSINKIDKKPKLL